MRHCVTIIEHDDENGDLTFVYQFDGKGIEVNHWYYDKASKTNKMDDDFITWKEIFNEKKHWES